jgi:hypothetical protein
VTTALAYITPIWVIRRLLSCGHAVLVSASCDDRAVGCLPIYPKATESYVRASLIASRPVRGRPMVMSLSAVIEVCVDSPKCTTEQQWRYSAFIMPTGQLAGFHFQALTANDEANLNRSWPVHLRMHNSGFLRSAFGRRYATKEPV